MAEVKLTLSPFKGLDLYSYPFYMQDGFSPDCTNVQMEAGILKTAKGFERINGQNGCILFFNHYKSDGGIVRLALRNGNIENLNNGQIYKENYYNENDSISMINYQLNDTYITIICNGRTTPMKFDGSSVTSLGGTPPVAAYAELHNERVFMAGCSNKPDRVYYSASFAPESWSEEIESGYIDLPSWDGGRIHQIKSVFGDLVVFKDHGLYRIYGTYPGEFGVEKISGNVGCVNKDAISVNGDSCYFISNLGLCLYNGMSAKLLDSKQLKAIFDKVDFNRIRQARLYDYSGKLYMFLPMEEDCIIEYDYSSGSVIRRTGFTVKQFFADTDGLYIVDDEGYVCKYNEGESHDGENITAHWKSKEYDLGSKGAIKNVLSLAVLAKGNGPVEVTVNTDREIKKIKALLDKTAKYYNLPIRARGRSFNVEIRNTEGSSFFLDGPCIYIDVEEE